MMLGSRKLRSAGVEGQIPCSALHSICFRTAQPQTVEIRSKIPAIKSQGFKKKKKKASEILSCECSHVLTKKWDHHVFGLRNGFVF